ncbi:hypothetical protein PR048_027637 [Dryococelus australis]|uniref:Uncharacterized protein n=1 Tax=Dryococelus australis TaxID=614101 RepID=A0ABQ9GH10_9NEOP|nr:hypothetical protein PR048_027637 [Dryococelus australis]
MNNSPYFSAIFSECLVRPAERNEEIWAALYSEVLRAGMKGRGKREILEKTRGPAASSGTIPTCQNPGSDPARDRTRFALVGGEQANRSDTVAPKWGRVGMRAALVAALHVPTIDEEGFMCSPTLFPADNIRQALFYFHEGTHYCMVKMKENLVLVLPPTAPTDETVMSNKNKSTNTCMCAAHLCWDAVKALAVCAAHMGWDAVKALAVCAAHLGWDAVKALPMCAPTVAARLNLSMLVPAPTYSAYLGHRISYLVPSRLVERNSSSVWSSAGMKGRGKWEIPEKTRRPAASSGTILKCENPGGELSGHYTTAAPQKLELCLCYLPFMLVRTAHQHQSDKEVRARSLGTARNLQEMRRHSKWFRFSCVHAVPAESLSTHNRESAIRVVGCCRNATVQGEAGNKTTTTAWCSCTALLAVRAITLNPGPLLQSQFLLILLPPPFYSFGRFLVRRPSKPGAAAADLSNLTNISSSSKSSSFPVCPSPYRRAFRRKATLSVPQSHGRLCKNTRLRLQHCTPVQSLPLSGDGALDAHGTVALIAPALPGLKCGEKEVPGRTTKPAAADFKWGTNIPSATNELKICRVGERPGANPRPSGYKSATLPLSYGESYHAKLKLREENIWLIISLRNLSHGVCETAAAASVRAASHRRAFGTNAAVHGVGGNVTSSRVFHAFHSTKAPSPRASIARVQEWPGGTRACVRAGWRLCRGVSPSLASR